MVFCAVCTGRICMVCITNWRRIISLLKEYITGLLQRHYSDNRELAISVLSFYFYHRQLIWYLLLKSNSSWYFDFKYWLLWSHSSYSFFFCIPVSLSSIFKSMCQNRRVAFSSVIPNYCQAPRRRWFRNFLGRHFSCAEASIDILHFVQYLKRESTALVKWQNIPGSSSPFKLCGDNLVTYSDLNLALMRMKCVFMCVMSITFE